ncbi:mate-domain-containing protein [Scheffersomyces amazonensis]|uniref:mate-domain-containing protein n=1 Tax=Scheffersomyces amazonensis TaxID=1078765 RepID=UPI00315D3235
MDSEEQLLIGVVDYENYSSLNEATDAEDLTSAEELKFITKASIPLVITFFLQYLLSVISIYAAGKLGAKELAAVSLAVCTFNITGLAIYQGMSTSLDSFCSQAYGSGKLHLVGVYFQRCSLMILAVTVFPLSLIWWFSGSILAHVIDDNELVDMIQTFLRILIFGTPGLVLFETGKRFLQAQHIFNAGTYVLVIVVPINYLLNWILVWHPTYGLGYVGIPIALGIVYWIISLLMLLYVLLIDGKKCWGGLDFEKAIKNWIPMLRLAIPGVIMVEAEYLAFEVLTILAASFGTSAIAAQAIASNVGSLSFQLPFAVAVALSTRIGHFVGMQSIRAASLVTKLTIIFAGIIALTNFSHVFFGRHYLSRLFTEDEEVIKITVQVLPLVALNQLGDAFNVIGAGVLRGQGRQRIGSILNMISYYVIALPLCTVLAFTFKFGLQGLWYGLISGVAFLAISEYVVIYRSDWPRIIVESKERHDH